MAPNKKGMKESKTVRQTKDAGFQIGVRKTLPISIDKAWDFLFSDEGLEIWLGKLMLSPKDFKSSMVRLKAPAFSGLRLCQMLISIPLWYD